MSREEEIREKAKSLYYNFCVRETCEGEEDCTNCSYGKVIEPLVSIAKWADQHPREGLWDATKVIRWLKEHISEYYMTNEFEECFDSMYEDLKKAMEK